MKISGQSRVYQFISKKVSRLSTFICALGLVSKLWHWDYFRPCTELKIWHLLVAKKSAVCCYIISYLHFTELYILSIAVNNKVFLMFIGPCIIAIVEEQKTNFMSLAILFHFLCAQYVSDINISIIRNLRLFC